MTTSSADLSPIAYEAHLSPSSGTFTRTEYRIRSARYTDLSPDDLDTLRRTFGEDWYYLVCTRHAEEGVALTEEEMSLGPYLVESRRIYGSDTDTPEPGLWHPVSIEGSLRDAYSSIDSFAGYRLGADRRTAHAVPLPTAAGADFAAYLALLAQRYVEHADFQRLAAEIEAAKLAARDLERASADVWRRLCASDSGLALAREWESAVLAATAAMSVDPGLRTRLLADPEFQSVYRAANSALSIPARRKGIKATMTYLRALGIEWNAKKPALDPKLQLS